VPKPVTILVDEDVDGERLGKRGRDPAQQDAMLRTPATPAFWRFGLRNANESAVGKSDRWWRTNSTMAIPGLRRAGLSAARRSHKVRNSGK
jgi:hypothetical protein